MLKKNRLNYVKTRIWKTDNSFIFPEQQKDHPDSIGEKANVGICFSGGGTRSATCTHGQLKALSDLGLLEKIGYISCVSGGAWTAVPYTYLDEHWEDSHFFGAVIDDPKEITLDLLNSVNERNFLHAVTHAGILDDAFRNWGKFAGDETYSRAIGEIFLEMFNINSLKKFFALSQNHVEDIISRNSNMRDSDFYTVRSNRPFIIASGALLRPGKKDYIFEMTPWYTGVHTYYKTGGSRRRPVGGGYIESFACDSDSPDAIRNNIATVRIGSRRHRFTLSDVLGTTGAAPSEVLHNLKVDFIGFPEFKYWSVRGKSKAKEYEIGDGGNIENLGIIPLIRRNVSKIIVFVNTKKPLSKNNKAQINSSVKDLFEKNNVNYIFDESKLSSLQDGLASRLAAGKATLYRDTYTVKNNEHHGIIGGNRVEVLWVYNHNYREWENKLPESVKEKIGKGKLANFPHFSTFNENFMKLIDLHPIQANLLSHMSCAVVRDNAAEFEQIVT